jgi:probable HAF family extracellular repeat protein
VTDLGTLGGTFSVGYALNSLGHVTGYSTTAEGASRAFVYDGTMRDLGTLDGLATVGWSINDQGQVAGVAEGGFSTRAFLYDGTMQDIGTLRNGAGLGWAYGINNSGVVTGWASWTNGTTNNLHAFRYDGAMQDLGSFGRPFADYSRGMAINDNGHVTGVAGSGQGFIYDGTLRPLGNLPGGTHSYGYAINASDMVTGYADITTPGENVHAFLWVDGVIQDLGTLPGTVSSYGRGINASGQIVGYATAEGNSAQRAFIYDPEFGMINLNWLIDPTLGWHIGRAYGINDAGQIVGLATINNEGRAVLLTPVPEPSMLLLGAIGLVSLALCSLRSPGRGVARAGVRRS